MFGLKLKVSQREVGELGLSISTSVAIEKLIAEESIPERELWINVRTLFRNLHGAVESDYREALRAGDVLPTLTTEMRFIANNIKGLEVHFYVPTYADIAQRLPHAIPRPVNTPKQIAYLEIESATMGQLLTDPIMDEVKVHKTKTLLHGPNPRVDAIMITHSPVDLLFTNFGVIRLLESHTGVFKTKTQWHTKLTNGNLLPNMPFNTFTVQVFGDNNNLLKAMPSAVRTQVADAAEADRWTPVSTRDRIAASINKIKDHYGRSVLLKILRS